MHRDASAREAGPAAAQLRRADDEGCDVDGGHRHLLESSVRIVSIPSSLNVQPEQHPAGTVHVGAGLGRSEAWLTRECPRDAELAQALHPIHRVDLLQREVARSGHLVAITLWLARDRLQSKHNIDVRAGAANRAGTAY